MKAITIRKERYGPPIKAFKVEDVNIPSIREDEVLIETLSSGLNYNNIWAATGSPLDVVDYLIKDGEPLPYMIPGSDGAGIVREIGKNVTNVKVGDEVIIIPIYLNENDYLNRKNSDIVFAKSVRAYGYETNFGTLGEYCRVKYSQCLPKASHLSWEESASFVLSLSTSYQMLFGYSENRLKKGEVVLIWGGAGGIGAYAIQLVKLAGGIPIAVVSQEERAVYCESLGAITINRNDFNHWNLFDPRKNYFEQKEWLSGVVKFRNAIKKLGKGKEPAIVFEHPGKNTIPTSLITCAKGGMIVTCGATSGYSCNIDLRYLWVNKKRIQGSHFSSFENVEESYKLIKNRDISTLVGEVSNLEGGINLMQRMYEGKAAPGKSVISFDKN